MVREGARNSNHYRFFDWLKPQFRKSRYSSLKLIKLEKTWRTWANECWDQNQNWEDWYLEAQIAQPLETASVGFAWASHTVYTPIYFVMKFNLLKSRFPLWKFLNQPVFDPQMPLVLNPQQFWQRHQIEYLERCWIRAYLPEERFRSWSKQNFMYFVKNITWWRREGWVSAPFCCLKLGYLKPWVKIMQLSEALMVTLSGIWQTAIMLSCSDWVAVI